MKFLVLSGAQIGKNSVVREKTFILDPEKLNIGENSSIGFYSEIYNSEENVSIGIMSILLSIIY